MARRLHAWVHAVALMAVLLLVASCKQQGPALGTPFIGGQKGLELSFGTNAPPKETFDGGQSPFAIALRIRNIGENALSKDMVKVRIDGIQAEEFSRSAADFTKNPPEDLDARRKDVQGNIVESNVVVTSFEGLNHKQPITGTALTFPVRASVCYRYRTIAASQLCSRSDILNPALGGICEVSGAKQVFNSGAPLQVEELVESPRSQSQVGFTFRIKQVDETGRLYEQRSGCDASKPRVGDKVFVEVRPQVGVGTVSCSGLSGGTGSNNGFVQLFDRAKTVTCVHDLGQRGDYQFPVTIDLSYDFENEVSTQLVVKHT